MDYQYEEMLPTDSYAVENLEYIVKNPNYVYTVTRSGTLGPMIHCLVFCPDIDAYCWEVPEVEMDIVVDLDDVRKELARGDWEVLHINPEYLESV